MKIGASLYALHALRRLGWAIRRPLTLGVRALLVQDSQVLLVKHTYQDSWYLPGGRVRKRETLEQAVRRELREELRAELKDVSLFGAYSNFYDHKNDHVVVFYCDDFTIGNRRRSEIEAVSFFPIAALPEAISPGSRHRIEELATDAAGHYGLW